jgi:hypothetical protein
VAHQLLLPETPMPVWDADRTTMVGLEIPVSCVACGDYLEFVLVTDPARTSQVLDAAFERHLARSRTVEVAGSPSTT